MEESIRSLFVDAKEELLGTLGQSYVTNVLHGERGNTVMALTNQRLYMKGNVLQKINNKYVRTAGSQVVALRDVSGTHTLRIERLGARIVMFILLGLGALLLVIGIIGMVGSAAASHGSSGGVFGGIAPSGNNRGSSAASQVMLLTFGVILAIIGGIGLLVVNARRLRLFVVEYSSGAVATRSDAYSVEEIEQFQKAVHIAKDRLLAGG